jgi:hypothetical protein
VERLIREAIAFHLEGLRKAGEPIPEPTAVGTTLVERPPPDAGSRNAVHASPSRNGRSGALTMMGLTGQLSNLSERLQTLLPAVGSKLSLANALLV